MWVGYFKGVQRPQREFERLARSLRSLQRVASCSGRVHSERSRGWEGERGSGGSVSGSWVRKPVVGVMGRKETRDGSKGGHALKLHWLCFDRLCLPRVPGWTPNRGTGDSRVQRIAACALKHIFNKIRRIPSSIEFLLSLSTHVFLIRVHILGSGT